MRAVAYRIEFTPEGRDHMKALTAHQRGIALDAMKRQLVHEPAVETRQRKRMKADKPGYVAPWELRVGELRVYYEVRDAEAQVWIVAIVVKRRNRLFVGGREIKVE